MFDGMAARPKGRRTIQVNELVDCISTVRVRTFTANSVTTLDTTRLKNERKVELIGMNDQLQFLTTSANILWLLVAGFLVFFMQAGFALVETGFTRAKNVAHTMMMNMMVFCIGAVGYWICGFAFQFGAVN